MKDWWLAMLTLIAGILSAAAVFVRPSDPLRGRVWLLWSVILLVFSFMVGSLKLWAWSSELLAKSGDLITFRNCLHMWAESRTVSLLAYGSFSAGFICLLVFGWRNLKFAN